MNRSLAAMIGLCGCILAAIVLFLQLRLERRLEGPMQSSTSLQLAQAQRQIDALSTSLSNALRQMDSLEARQRGLMNQPAILPRSPQVTAFQTVEPTSPIRRAWSPEQVIGAPDTMQAGDKVTAWASRSPDGGAEWLNVDYERQVQIAEEIG